MKLMIFGILASLASANTGSAGFYSPPYTPSACAGNDLSQFPPNKLFVSVGVGLWDNGAACGRQYRVRCISSDQPNACKRGTIDVIVMDRWNNPSGPKSSPRATMLLSNTAWAAIVDTSKRATRINIEYVQAN